MNLRRELRKMADAHEHGSRELWQIVARAQKLRRRSLAISGIAVALVVAVGFFVAQSWESPRGAGVTDRPGSRIAPAAGPGADTPTPTRSPTTLEQVCASADGGYGCGDDSELLAKGEEWLGDILRAAGLEYRNGYRPDGGGSHAVPAWGFGIHVLRPPPEIPESVAARFGHRPLWTSEGITVFGLVRDDSPMAYFYWRAGSVDTWVSLDWASSPAQTPEDLKAIFRRLIVEQQQKPYPEE